MSRRFVKLALFAVLALGVGAACAEEAPDALRAAVDEAVTKVKPALVRIHVVFTEYGEGRELKYESQGSGAIITKEGHVITNHHVAGHAVRAFCTLADKEEIEAELVAADPLTDIAVMKLLPEEPREFPTASFGDSSRMEVGDNVLAMGSPMALSQSVTLGIISNIEMIVPGWMRAYGGLKQDGEDVGKLVKWIGHDAHIAGGNSGGPLVNMRGEIIGINELRMGLNGAIPGNLAKDVSGELMANGTVRRAWLGIEVQPLLKHSDRETGVLVGGAIEDSPAGAAGIQSGDILLSLGGQPVNVKFLEQLPEFNRVVADLAIGEEIAAVVWRDGAEVTLKLTPAEREPKEPKQRELKEWGITARDLSLVTAKEMKRKDQRGVLVTSVRAGGGAGEAKPRIERRDVIVEVDGKPIGNVDDLVAVTKELAKDKKERVPVLTAYERKTERFVTVVKVGHEEHEDPGLEVKKAWLPVETQVISRDISELLESPDLTGFRITHVYANSTAEKAGLQTGDFILKVDGEKLTANAPEDFEELPALIRQYKVGTATDLSVRRGTEDMALPVELISAPKLAREMKEYRDEDFEFTVRDITFFDKAREQWEEGRKGVLVSEVKSGGWAALGELRNGDLVMAVDGTEIVDVAAFETLIEGLAQTKPSSVVIQVRRGIYTIYLEIEPKWADGD